MGFETHRLVPYAMLVCKSHGCNKSGSPRTFGVLFLSLNRCADECVSSMRPTRGRHIMNQNYKTILGTFSALMLTGATLLPSGAFAQDAGAENVQVLTRGPVHEAFAESVSFDPQPGLIISTRVPDAIEEMPPEQQLEGDNVTWISGYWAWDDDQNDFIWISGIWRNLPPGRQWVPGYWNGIDDGQYQWTSGYWADATTEEVPISPPRRRATSMPAQYRRALRPTIAGSPATGCGWTPAMPGGRVTGCRCGRTGPGCRPATAGPAVVTSTWMATGTMRWRTAVCSSPRCISAHAIMTGRIITTLPSIVVALNVFADHLFMRPRYGHYYFGDYYAPRYGTPVTTPPIRGTPATMATIRSMPTTAGTTAMTTVGTAAGSEDFNYFRDHEDARPPHTWAAMRDSRQDRFNDGRNRNYATPLSSFAKMPSSAQSFRIHRRRRAARSSSRRIRR